ncbi:MAG: ABC transporter [Candidatus Staskawiczbacteria bacterium RIFCSPHIGHO2_02_FULL_42_22]|uniref:Transport permease protein n=1 Tax=Candidatus Staskawiczbacteria bacterium RIFCSPHIGHO2_02_FULL_42_22 TaxID=1802207 RepID=A0A1G2I330_9BACT|nr:MAG: ABC transporter [Candidatus Staskawiczbacteria bacterium RIFCSPHIGHO2_02_FULL_42_22]
MAQGHIAPQGLKWVISDTIAMTWRGLLRYVRMPQLLIFSTIQPILFLLLFAYVFGGAIQTPGLNYINFLVPGILVQVVIFGSVQTGVGLAEDLGKGMIDRFRSLPMARSAVLTGRTLADLVRNIFVMILMIAVAGIMGFRAEGGFFRLVLALGMIALFGFAFSWISAAIGLSVRNSETAQVAGFIWVFPLVFASSIFVPIDTMPGWLEAFAKISPITVTVNSVRALMVGTPIGDNWWQSLIWIFGILIDFSMLSVLQYRRAR